jgi:ATP-dependent Clp protease adaptor protein ClpS
MLPDMDRGGAVRRGPPRKGAAKVSATKVGRTRGTRTEDGIGPEPPYKVVLHDSWHPMSWVVYVLVKAIPGTPVGRAVEIMWEAHTKGRAVAKRCHREFAELYEERLKGKGLSASVEADY